MRSLSTISEIHGSTPDVATAAWGLAMVLMGPARQSDAVARAVRLLWGCNASESHVSLVSLSLLIRCHALRLGFFGVLASLRSWLRLHTRRICSSLYAGVFLPYGAARTYALCNVVGYILELRRPRDRRAWNKRESTRVSASGHWSSAGERDVEREHRASSVCTLFPAFCDWTWLG